MRRLGDFTIINPLRSLGESIDRREAHDLTPIPLEQVPGEISPLVTAITYLDKDLQMPPKGEKLTADQLKQELQGHLKLLDNVRPIKREAIKAG